MTRAAKRVALLAAATSLIVSACTGSTAPAWTFSPDAAPPAASASVDPARSAPPAAPSGEVLGTIAMESFDLGFTPGKVEVEQPGTYEVKLANTGSLLHDVTFADGTKIEAKAGETATATVTIPEGGTTFLCSVPGHADAGMKGEVAVGGQATAASGGGGDGGPAPATDVEADPDAPAPVTLDATAPKLATGTLKEVELVVTERAMTVAKGFVQSVWTLGDTVPGPVLRAKVGDTIRITLKNPATNRLPHSIDFHSSFEAWNDEMTSIDPGEEKVYEWTADLAGVYMYHCGTAPALHHIGNGMYGMVIVEPKEGLAPVDKEFVLVQSEWYLGPQGQPSSLEKMSAAAPAPEFVVFNGVAGQYLDAPLKVGVNERVRVFLLDAGPSIDSSFHVVGTIFDRVVKEGSQEIQAGWGAQAVDLSPAQGAIVEMTFKEEGLYPIVTHAFNFPGRGALGLFQAGDGDPTN